MGLILAQHQQPLAYFVRQMVRARDDDPHYWLTRALFDLRAYDEVKRYRYLAAFHGFYHFKSTESWWNDRRIDPAELPYGISRRGFRRNRKVLDFIADVEELRPHLWRQRGRGEAGWAACYEMVLGARGAGPWSAYGFVHNLNVVLDFGITAPDLGDLGSSDHKTGPSAGISLLTGIPIPEIVGNRPLHRRVYAEVAHLFRGMEVFESILCCYNSLHKNRYYIGRDIDRQLPQIIGQGLPDHERARREVFPAPFLGEVGGWTAVRKELMGRMTYAGLPPL